MQYDLTLIGIILAIISILSPILIKSYKILKIKYGFGLTYNIFGFENQKNEPKLSIEVERALPESKKINILTFRGISDFAVSDSIN
jgi:Tfp pilus assembly major pilin PilA